MATPIVRFEPVQVGFDTSDDPLLPSVSHGW